MVSAISLYREKRVLKWEPKFFKSLLTKISDTQSALNTFYLKFHISLYGVSVSLSISLTVYCLGEESGTVTNCKSGYASQKGKESETVIL